jgi:hypothetical protein
MRASVSKNITGSIHDRLLHFGASGDREDGVPRSNPTRPVPVDREDLPYKVEIWNEPGASVEQVVAVTANASIGYAACYAATREYRIGTSHCVIRTVSSPAGAGRDTDTATITPRQIFAFRDRRREPR